jgi:cytoskeletal protein RodZ
MPEIGETLREARMRRRIDMTEVETATKIRGKYLRALENEEWDLLPGPTFVKSFLRTYAEYLGLDARLLVEEYRQRYERPASQDLTPFSAARRGRSPRRRQRLASMGPVLVIGGFVVGLLAVLWVLGTIGNNDDETPAPPNQAQSTPTPTPDAGKKKHEAPARPGARATGRDRPGLRVPRQRVRQAGDRRADAGGRHAL